MTNAEILREPNGRRSRAKGTSKLTREQRFWNKVKKTDGCWNWTAARCRSYGIFAPDGKVPTGAHRVSWRLAFGEIPDGLFVLHKCDNPLCVRPDHLFLGTQSDNIKDKVNKGRQQRGSGAGGAKLTERDVMEIKARALRGEKTRALADYYGVSFGNVWMILTGKTWTHVSPEMAA
jgi:hypothetical protein